MLRIMPQFKSWMSSSPIKCSRRNMRLELSKSELESWHYYSQVVWSWTRPLTSLCFCFLYNSSNNNYHNGGSLRFKWNSIHEKLLEIAYFSGLSFCWVSTMSIICVTYLGTLNYILYWFFFLIVFFSSLLPNYINFLPPPWGWSP